MTDVLCERTREVIALYCAVVFMKYVAKTCSTIREMTERKTHG